MKHLQDILLISAFIVPLILSVTILIDSRGFLPKRVMALALLNAFFVFFANYFYFKKLTLIYIPFHSLHIATVLCLFPSIYLYIKSIVGDDKTFKKELWHLFPGLMFGIISAILFYGLLNQDERIYYLTTYRSGIKFMSIKLKIIYTFRLADVVFIVLQVVYYSIVILRIPAKYHERLKHEYSNIESFSLNWVWWFNASFILIGLLSILFYMFNPFDTKNDLFLVFFLFSISVFMWIIGVWSFKQQKPKDLVTFHRLVIENNKNSNHSSEKVITKQLLDYFEKEQPYLNPELNLTTVCKNIGTNRTYLSNAINDNFGMNFNAFVNAYRVQHVREYLKQYPHSSKEDLALAGGFGSVSSLKRAMIKVNKENSANGKNFGFNLSST